MVSANLATCDVVMEHLTQPTHPPTHPPMATSLLFPDSQPPPPLDTHGEHHAADADPAAEQLIGHLCGARGDFSRWSSYGLGGKSMHVLGAGQQHRLALRKRSRALGMSLRIESSHSKHA